MYCNRQQNRLFRNTLKKKQVNRPFNDKMRRIWVCLCFSSCTVAYVFFHLFRFCFHSVVDRNKNGFVDLGRYYVIVLNGVRVTSCLTECNATINVCNILNKYVFNWIHTFSVTGRFYRLNEKKSWKNRGFFFETVDTFSNHLILKRVRRISFSWW